MNGIFLLSLTARLFFCLVRFLLRKFIGENESDLLRTIQDTTPIMTDGISVVLTNASLLQIVVYVGRL